MSYSSVYHHEHPLYRKIASYNGMKSVGSDPVKDGDLVLYSGGSFLDYVYLTDKYSPVFCALVKDEEGDDVYCVAYEIGSIAPVKLVPITCIFDWDQVL